MTEQELATRARAGDTAAFAALVATYQTPVYNLCYRMLGEATEAEDAAQESFLRAYSQLVRYDPSRPFKSWLFAIADHYCIDLLRRRRLKWLDIDDEELAFHPALSEQRPGPEESALQQERDAGIQALLDRLAPSSRSIIVLRYWYGLSYEEIAGVTGISVPAVKSRLHRAREVLAAIVTPPAGSRPAQPQRREGNSAPLRRMGQILPLVA
jgi:RNA polymerase sigma-70 factor, ECF subfamily